MKQFCDLKGWKKSHCIPESIVVVTLWNKRNYTYCAFHGKQNELMLSEHVLVNFGCVAFVHSCVTMAICLHTGVWTLIRGYFTWNISWLIGYLLSMTSFVVIQISSLSIFCGLLEGNQLAHHNSQQVFGFSTALTSPWIIRPCRYFYNVVLRRLRSLISATKMLALVDEAINSLEDQFGSGSNQVTITFLFHQRVTINVNNSSHCSWEALKCF